jgi:type IV secretion system protein VirB5
MRKLLLAASILSAVSGESRAQVATYDAVNHFQQIQDYVQQLKGYVLESQKYATQLQQYSQEVRLYVSFVHDPSLGAAAGLIARSGYGDSLPVNPYAVQSLATGYGSMDSLQGIIGKLSVLGSMMGNSYSTNHVYSPADGSWNSEQLISNGNSIAGMQGTALATYNDLEQHRATLSALRDRLNTAQTPKDVQDAQASIEAEQAYMGRVQTQLQAIQVAYSTQRDARIQRDDEVLTRDIDLFLGQAEALK